MIKNQKKLKLGLDMAMIIALLLLMVPKILGQEIHEWSGLIIGAIIISHLVLNRQWIKSVSRNLVKISSRSKVLYILDFLLLLGFTLIILSGVYISKTINFSCLGLDYNHNLSWKMIHMTVSYITLILAGIHLGLNFNWVINIFNNKQSQLAKGKQNRKTLLNMAFVVLILTAGIFSFNYLDYASKANPALLITAIEKWDETGGSFRGGEGRGEGFRRGIESDLNNSRTLAGEFSAQGRHRGGDKIHGQSAGMVYLLLAFAGVFFMTATGVYFIDRKLK